MAPLAGWTDLAFRATVKKFGADLTFSEMVSSNALVYNYAATKDMLLANASEDPFFVQISGNSAEIIKDAVGILNDLSHVDGIDLNSGCPAPKVVAHGSGSSLLRDLAKLERFISTIKLHSKKPYTSVKVRIGFDEKIPAEIARACEAGGADFITIHGRTKKGGYVAQVDYEAIAAAKRAVKIPVIANGDITDYQKAQDVLAVTNADGIMIGRAALGNPWIFWQLKQSSEQITNKLRSEVILEHFDNTIKLYGDYGAVIFRKHFHRYSKNYAGATDFRNEINTVTDPSRARSIAAKFFGES